MPTKTAIPPPSPKILPNRAEEPTGPLGVPGPLFSAPAPPEFGSMPRPPCGVFCEVAARAATPSRQVPVATTSMIEGQVEKIRGE